MPETPPGPARIGLVAITSALYLLAAAFVAVGRSNWEFVMYVTVVVVLGGVVWVVHRRVWLPLGMLWALSGWGLAHMLGGLMPVPESWPIDGDMRVLYSWWLVPEVLKYDHVVHAYGFGVSTWICWVCLRTMVAGRGRPLVPTPGMLALVACAGMGLGAMNEVVEFAATRLMPETNVGGYVNTGWDLVSNLVGCVVAAAIIAVGPRGERAA